MTVSFVLFVLDLSLSLSGSPIGILYNHMMELMDSLERHEDLMADVLMMGTGDDGEGCQWLCNGMCPIADVRGALSEFRAMGHTPLMKAVEEVAGRVAALDDPTKTAVVFITDGQVGFTTAGEVADAVSGCLRGCHRMVLLVGFNHDEDVMVALASSERMVFGDTNSVSSVMDRLVGGWP